VERTVEASLEQHRDILVESMLRGGYSLQREDGGELRFRASSPIRRLLAMGDDAVTIKALTPNTVAIGGVRKGVVEAEFRISSQMRIWRQEHPNQQ
jgi:hypothetical protein